MGLFERNPDVAVAVGDTLPPVEATLRWPATLAPVDLTDASVVFVMTERATGILRLVGECTLVSAPDGQVRYDWQSVDTAIPGDYDAVFEVTAEDGGKMTIPNTDQKLLVRITGDLGDRVAPVVQAQAGVAMGGASAP